MSLVETETNPVPPGVVTGMIRTRDGQDIRFARWPAITSNVRGTVCLLQGRSEFIEKYFETVDDLRRRGYAVATFDWRGQGGSSRILKNTRKGYVDDIADYHEDLDCFMQQIVLPDCSAPYYSIAHSTGALILLTSLRDRPTRFDRVVLSAPLLRIYTNPRNSPTSGFLRLFNPLTAPFRKMMRGLTSHNAMRRAAALLSYLGFGEAYIPFGSGRGLEAGRFNGRILTSDETRLQSVIDLLDKNPNLGLGSPTIAWVYAMLRAMDLMGDPNFHIPISTPILMVGAGRDRVVSSRQAECAATVIRSASYVEIPGSAHEILMEQDIYREQFLALFDAFITEGQNDLADAGLIGA